MAFDSPGGGNQDPRITAGLASTLAQAPVLFDQLHALTLSGPSDGSEAAAAIGPPLAHHSAILSADHLSTGLEHLVTWNRLLLGGVQPYASHITLVRGALEGSVTCRWLVDPRADAAERTRRGVALLLDDYKNRADFERDFGIPPEAIKPPAKSGADRAKELQTERDAAGIGRIDVPRMTARFGGYLGLEPAFGRAIYRLLSAYAHGRQWKGLTVTHVLSDAPPDATGAREAKVTANDDMSLPLTVLGIKNASTALAELHAYFGRDY